jgi:NTE family protein
VGQKRIAIACQGGGSQCAFVAGALKALFAQGIQHRFKIVGLSGTSGGAITAALAWAGLLAEARGDRSPIGDRIIACWNDLTAQTPLEIGLDRFTTQALRLVERGLVPSTARSPSSLQFRFLSQLTSALIGRPAFTDLRALLLKHLDFEALASSIEPDSPVLLVGACDVLEGEFKVFSSVRREIGVDAILASAAVPSLFPAVRVNGHAYWDGIFSANPPVAAFLRKPLMGGAKEMRPEEIWIIQVNPVKVDSLPETSSDIFDRRNHLSGNLSLQHELQMIEVVNVLLREHALTDDFRRQFGFDTTEQIAVRFIRMSDTIRKHLDYPSKLSRDPRHISTLIADGEAQAAAFLAELGDHEQPHEGAVEEMAAQIH